MSPRDEEFRRTPLMRERDLSSRDDLRRMSGKSPDELEEEIDQIRSEMEQTLSNIERKFSLPGLIERAQDRIEAGPGEFAANLGRSIRDNPVAAVLACVGLVWLAWGSRHSAVEVEYAPRTAPPRRYRTSPPRNKWKEASHRLDLLRGKARRARKEEGSRLGRGRRLRVREPSEEDLRRYRRPLMMGTLGAAVGAAVASVLPLSR